MDLDFWMFKNKVSRLEMARQLNINPGTLIALVKKRRTPTLFTCLAVEKYTRGEVTLVDLLSPKDLHKLDNVPIHS